MVGLSWFAVDTSGCDLRTGAPPTGVGAPSPVEALAAVPIATWPLAAVSTDGRGVGLGEVLGDGGAAVEDLLWRLLSGPAALHGGELERLARCTPAGPLTLPVSVVSLGEGVEAAGSVDGPWLAGVDARRGEARRLLQQSGRERGLEAALRVTMLLATDRLPSGGTPSEVRVASGAQLWLLAGAVAWAMAGSGDNPFGPWAALVSAGYWPIGPVGRDLVVSAAGPVAAG